MDLRQLRYFLAIAEPGQLTAAAVALGLQQPPLSQQIQSLEHQLGMRLFNRHPKGVVLTDGGRFLAQEARRLLADFDAMRARVAAAPGHPSATTRGRAPASAHRASSSA